MPKGKVICLVSCVSKKKVGRHLARDIYDSPWFKKARAFAEQHCDAWFILSAQHGLLRPDAVIEHYDKSLNRMSSHERRRWAARVLKSLYRILNREDCVLILAGKRYREFLLPEIAKRCARVTVPMERMRVGEQLQWLERQVSRYGQA
ncbi:MAG: DUF6884 domain-containing protein [Phycisphaerae bacterium]